MAIAMITSIILITIILLLLVLLVFYCYHHLHAYSYYDMFIIAKIIFMIRIMNISISIVTP